MRETETPLAQAPIVAEIVDEDVRPTVIVLEILERQLVAGQTFGVQVADAATDITAAVVEAPAQVIAAIRDGATLPAALGRTGDALQSAAADVGSRVRAAVGSYVNSQSALPNAVITGASEVTAEAIRAQGNAVASVIDGVFTVATAATQGGDVRDAVALEWHDLVTFAKAARSDVDDALKVARQGIRVALPVVPTVD